MSQRTATMIGEVQSVSGSTVSVRLHAGISSLLLIEGDSHRVGQIGSFLRIPLGFTHLYGVCTQVGASAQPQPGSSELDQDGRWMTLTLFGEVLGNAFERGVGQFPTIGDEVHLVTNRELKLIYRSAELATPIEIGTIASATGISAHIDLSRLVSRHSAIVGSSGSGKSNLVAILLEAIASQGYPSARVVVLDPHGEYGNAIGPEDGVTFSVTPNESQLPLRVPFWALPFHEFAQVTIGDSNPLNLAAVGTEVENLRRDAAVALPNPPAQESVSPDSPIPFSARRLWCDLMDYERRTYKDAGKHNLEVPTQLEDPDKLIANVYPPQAIGSGAPYLGPRRGITRNLELMRNRMMDSRYRFLFEPGDEYTPDIDGAIQQDLDSLVSSWIGHDKPITVLDLSGTPADVLPVVTGTVLRIIYDSMFWAAGLPSGGQRQPLLVILEEAHLFVPEGADSAAQRVVAKIAKEGRKYGVGLMLVTQRPSEIDSTALSQCGTMLALRLTNQADRAKVGSTMPDDLASLSSLLPSLRTGEAIVTGEAASFPTRVRVPLARNKPMGADADLAAGWRMDTRPSIDNYTTALANWRALSLAAASAPTKATDESHEKQDGANDA